MDHDDFAIRIHSEPGGSYVVEVEQAPVLGPGDARPQAAMEFPSDAATLQSHLDQLQEALRRSETTLVGRPRFRDMEAPEEPESHVSVQELGQVLFEAAFPDAVRSCYESSLRQAKAQQRGLRIRLHVEAPELATLPWEYLYDEGRRTFVCLSPETPIVRYLKTKDSPAPIEVEGPLRILGMVAAPTADTALPRLDVESEKRRIEQVLRPLARSITLEWLEGQTWRHLQEAMRRGPWHVFHFIGHGGFDAASGEGVLVFAKEDGREHRLPAPKVATLLTDHPPLRLVVLNACQGAQASADDLLSSTASALILGGIPAVVAMQYKISDLAAIEFSRGFYASLADGYPVDASVAEARKSVNLSMDYTVEWGTPVLHMQSSDGRLFDLTAVTPRAAESVPGAAVEVDVEPGAARSAVATPTVAPASARGGRGGVLRWAGIFVGVVVGVVALLFVVNLVRYVLFNPEEEIPAEVLALMSTGGYERYDVDADHAQRLAETIVGEERALLDQGYTQSEARISTSAVGDTLTYSVLARSGFTYEIRGHCGEDCQNLNLVLYDTEAEEGLLIVSAFDSGRNPILTVPLLPNARRYNLDVEVLACGREEKCLSAYSVYRKPVPDPVPR